MILKANFTESDQVLKADFGEVHIVERGGYEQGYEQGKQDGYTSGYNEGYTKGDSEGYDKGYDIGYDEGFASAPPDYLLSVWQVKFHDINIYGKETLTLNIPYVTNYYEMLAVKRANETVKHLIVNGGDSVTNMGFMLYGVDDHTLKRVTWNCSTSKVTNFAYAFFKAYALEIIDGVPFDFSNANDLSSALSNCKALKEVRIVPQSIKLNFSVRNIPNLSPETRQSITDGLADLTGQTAQTLTVHAEVGVKLTDEQKAVITAKNWILAY
jgi:hypothetical protein